MKCINCGRLGTVTRAGDEFACAKCGHAWTVEDEQANAAYIAMQGRKPATPIADAPPAEAGEPVDEIEEILAPVTEPMPNDPPEIEIALEDLDPDDGDATAIDATRDAGPLTEDEYAALVEALDGKTVPELDAIADDARVELRHDDVKRAKLEKIAQSGRVYVSDGAIIVIYPDED